MANRLDDFFLPWQNRRKELKILALGLALFFLFSLGFFPCFFNERAALIERGIHDAATARLLDPSIAYRSMPPFWTMARGFLMAFSTMQSPRFLAASRRLTGHAARARERIIPCAG